MKKFIYLISILFLSQLINAAEPTLAVLHDKLLAVGKNTSEQNFDAAIAELEFIKSNYASRILRSIPLRSYLAAHKLFPENLQFAPSAEAKKAFEETLEKHINYLQELKTHPGDIPPPPPDFDDPFAKPTPTPVPTPTPKPPRPQKNPLQISRDEISKKTIEPGSVGIKELSEAITNIFGDSKYKEALDNPFEGVTGAKKTTTPLGYFVALRDFLDKKLASGSLSKDQVEDILETAIPLYNQIVKAAGGDKLNITSILVKSPENLIKNRFENKAPAKKPEDERSEIDLYLKKLELFKTTTAANDQLIKNDLKKYPGAYEKFKFFVEKLGKEFANIEAGIKVNQGNATPKDKERLSKLSSIIDKLTFDTTSKTIPAQTNFNLKNPSFDIFEEYDNIK